MLHKIESSFKENVGRNLQCTTTIGRSGSSTKNEASKVDSSPNFPASFNGLISHKRCIVVIATRMLDSLTIVSISQNMRFSAKKTGI
ncbi:hypothetical protein V6N13_084885 [Hibiscus sabdariffa]|uniref:Uncharacterized protein n=1 Tax=Hibiscus sabdariffa TaxID=183260 RepID=A0ABR2CZU4_9ROSI